MKYTLNDFFCGCGGMGIGFKDAGFEIVGAWDFDKYACKTYKANVDDRVIQADIRNMHYSDIPKADVWAFGFPCQDLSVAGKKAGMILECMDCGNQWTIDPETYNNENACTNCGSIKNRSANRSGLFFEIMRLIDETSEKCPGNLPKVLIAENVKGLKPFIPVLEAEYKKRGYTAHVQLLNSKYFGVPQNRERYFIVGTKDDQDLHFAFPEQNENHVPKLSSVLDIQVDEKYYIDDKKAKNIIEQAMQRIGNLGSVHATITPDRINKRQNGRHAKEDEEEMFTLTAQDVHGIIADQEDLQKCFTCKDGSAYACTASYQNGLNLNNPLRCRSRTVVVEEEPQIKLVGMLDISAHDHSRRVHDPDGISPTVTAVAGGTHHIKIIDYKKYRVRRLTPTEYGRLQAFPMDKWVQVVSDSQAYKQFGNAVTTTVAKAIAIKIKECFDQRYGTEEIQFDEFDPIEQLRELIANRKELLCTCDEEMEIVYEADIMALEMAIRAIELMNKKSTA